MKKTRTFILALFILLSYFQVKAQCTLACLADFNVSLDDAGNATLTPEDVLSYYGPNCGTLTLSPSNFSCSDIGAPVEYTVTSSTENECSGNVHVRFNYGALVCNATLTIALPPSGIAVLDPELLLADPHPYPASCVQALILSTSTLSCDDIGTTVRVFVTDPGNGNSCWTDIDIRDPRPESCEINAPVSIECGDVGVPFTSAVTGGYGPFDYNWQIKGNPNGWAITSGQGSDNITMDVGTKKVKLELTLTDVCDKKRKCSVKLNCSEPAALNGFSRNTFTTISEEDPIQSTDSQNFSVFPNPSSQVLNVNYSELASIHPSQVHIIDRLGRRHHFTTNGQDLGSELVINIQDLQPGVYWLIVNDHAKGVVTKKFVKL